MISLIGARFSALAEQHYKRIIRAAQSRPKADRKWYVDDRLKRAIVNDSKKINRFLKEFRNDILINDTRTKQNIITATPDNLHKYVLKYIRNYGESFLNSKELKEKLEQILYYDSYENWDADLLAEKIGINTCLYCNRQYIQSYDKNGVRNRTLEFDHFYCRKYFPYLALSFYNLIPSCHTFNSIFKRTEKFTINSHIHPYREGFESKVKFSITPKNIGFVNGVSDAYELDFKYKNAKAAFKTRVKRNIKTFHLVNLYKEHRDIIDEIIMKSQIYNKAYISNLYNTYAGTLFSGPEDANRLVLGNYLTLSDLDKRPLSKLTSDIASELKII